MADEMVDDSALSEVGVIRMHVFAVPIDKFAVVEDWLRRNAIQVERMFAEEDVLRSILFAPKGMRARDDIERAKLRHLDRQEGVFHFIRFEQEKDAALFRSFAASHEWDAVKCKRRYRQFWKDTW